MCKGATFFNLVKAKIVKKALFLTLFLYFLTCSFSVKQANAVVDPVGFVFDIFGKTSVKTEKIQPDIKPDSLLKAKTEKIQPDIPKLPTKKSEKLIPEMKIVDDIKGVLFIDVNKYKKEFSNPENIKQGLMYMVGADIIAEKFNNKADDKISGSNSSDGVNIVSLGTTSNPSGILGKGPPVVPLYNKTPFINNPIEDLGNITGNYLNEIAPIHKVLPSISPSGGEIIDDVNSYLDDTIDLFDNDSRPAPDKVLDSKLIIFD